MKSFQTAIREFLYDVNLNGFSIVADYPVIDGEQQNFLYFSTPQCEHCPVGINAKTETVVRFPSYEKLSEEQKNTISEMAEKFIVCLKEAKNWYANNIF